MSGVVIEFHNTFSAYNMGKEEDSIFTLLQTSFKNSQINYNYSVQTDDKTYYETLVELLEYVNDQVIY